MAGSGRLQADPLFQGLTRPAMVLGVSYTFFVFNCMLIMITYINTSSFTVLFVVGPLIHGICYLICLKEPRMMELIILYCSQGLKCRNRRFHGRTNSYDL